MSDRNVLAAASTVARARFYLSSECANYFLKRIPYAFLLRNTYRAVETTREPYTCHVDHSHLRGKHRFSHIAGFHTLDDREEEIDFVVISFAAQFTCCDKLGQQTSQKIWTG